MMKKINVETLVPNTFKFLARDMDGKLYAFEKQPNVATDIACDTWDVKEGEILQVTPPVAGVDSVLGDWRESLIEINGETL
jgi:hypothetical protein